MSYNQLNSFYLKTAANKTLVSESGSKLFGVTVDTFTNWFWQMKHQIQRFEDLPKSTLKYGIQKEAFSKVGKNFHIGLSPYSFSLIDFENNVDPIKAQLMPSELELSDVHGVRDPLKEEINSPVKEVVHVYKDRVAFCVALLCPVYCRYCFRKRREEEHGLHYNPRIIDEGIAYIASNKNIRDVLITGGDPLIAHDSAIEKLLQKLRQIPHVEIIRFGTRVPVFLPYRITEKLASILEKYHPIWINTHFNSSKEITPDATKAIDILLRKGIPVGNQSVLLKNINDSFDKMKALLEALVRIRVRPYYVYHPQIVEGTEHLRVPVELGYDIFKKLRGQTSGFALPQYILDTPSGKVPLSPNNLIGRYKDYIVLEQINGRYWLEPNPIEGYFPNYPIVTLNDHEFKKIRKKSDMIESL